MSNHLQWTSTLFRSLYKSGVRHAILSPGSRSGPLTVAAAIHPGFKKQVVLDERSAAFIALGIGKATGFPAVLVCTSGTAVANYLPAVVEARESGVPIIILTADRPPNLRGIGSSQTVDQIKIFGEQAVFFHEAGEPVFDETDLKRVRYLGYQAVQTAIEYGGVAHINLPFRKPLESSENEIKREKEINHQSLQTGDSDSHSASRVIHLNKSIQTRIRKAKKPLIIAGPTNAHQSLKKQISDLSGKIHAPVLAEPGSGIAKSDYTIFRFEQFLRNKSILAKLKPDLILRFGDQPFTKSLLSAFESWDDIPVFHFSARNTTQDHSMNVNEFVLSSAHDSVIWPETDSKSDSKWLKAWKENEIISQEKLLKELKKESVLTDGHVFYALSNSLPANWNVMLSNSFIPRDMALFGKHSVNQFVNRGAAGIDGIISTATGIHRASDRPTLCISGDLAFLHDSNSLLSIKGSTHPFLILIINNGGGTIFRMLPIHENSEFFETYFETPQNVEIKSLVKAHKLGYQKITSISELDKFDLSKLKGTTVFECVTDPDRSMNLRNQLWNS